MALNIAETIVKITDRLHIPYVFKGSYRKANRSRIDSFTGIGDEKALKILRKVGEIFNIPVVTDIHSAEEARMAAEYADILQITCFFVSTNRSFSRCCRDRSCRKYKERAIFISGSNEICRSKSH